MNRFYNLWRSIDSPSNSASTPDAVSGGTRTRLAGHQRQLQSQSRQNANPPHLDWRDVSQYSAYSTQGPFQTRMFFSENLMLGSGSVIIQPSSGKVVIVQDGDRWFLPKGRKDLGESLEEAALREAYEEVGVPPS